MPDITVEELLQSMQDYCAKRVAKGYEDEAGLQTMRRTCEGTPPASRLVVTLAAHEYYVGRGNSPRHAQKFAMMGRRLAEVKPEHCITDFSGKGQSVMVEAMRTVLNRSTHGFSVATTARNGEPLNYVRERRASNESRQENIVKLRHVIVLGRNRLHGVPEEQAVLEFDSLLDLVGPVEKLRTRQASSKEFLTPKEFRTFCLFIREQGDLDGGEARLRLQEVQARIGYGAGVRPINQSRLHWGIQLRRGEDNRWRVHNPSLTRKREAEVSVLDDDASRAIEQYLLVAPARAILEGQPVNVHFTAGRFLQRMTGGDIGNEMADVAGRSPLTKRLTGYFGRRSHTNNSLAAGLTFDQVAEDQGRINSKTVRDYVAYLFQIRSATNAYHGLAGSVSDEDEWECPKCPRLVSAHLTKCPCGATWLDRKGESVGEKAGSDWVFPLLDKSLAILQATSRSRGP